MEVKKNKLLEMIKTILIFFLILFACYQLFDMNSDVSVFELISEHTSHEKVDNEYYLKPESIMISFGNNDFVSINFDSNQESLIREYLRKIYKEIFNGKKSLEQSSHNIVTLLNQKSIIISYSDYDENVTSELFNITNDKVLKTLNKIEKVIIVPSETSDTETKVYFIKNENAYTYETNLDTIELYGLIDEINLFSQMNIYKLSENLSYGKYFNRYVFIPEIQNDFSLISDDENIKVSNPFYINNEIDESLLEGYVNIFFENPKAKWKMEKDENVILYGDGERTISAYKDGYFNYSFSNITNKNISLEDAIKVADKKLKLDTYLNNNVRLSNVSKLNDYSYELSYDYYINNCKVIFSNTIMNKYKITYPLQIVVNGDEVSSYKAIALKFENNKELIEANIEDDITINVNKNKTYVIKLYKEIIDELVQIYPDIKIKDFKIGYSKSNMYDDAKLMWIVKTTEGTFTYTLK